MSHDPAEFSTTQWSVVQAAGGEKGEESKKALAHLCQRYWPPLYAFACRQTNDVHDAQDLTQGFFERLLEKNYIAQADAERGRFRQFLLAAFKHYMLNEWAKRQAEKRGGSRPPISMDFNSMGPFLASDDLTADQLFERQWTLTLLEQVMQRLEGEYAANDKQQQFQLLKRHIVPSERSARYAETAEKLGVTEAATRMAASRLRQRYRELLHEEIARTVRSPDQIQDEITYLFQTLG